jgi:uncharacterized protein (DUF362 family)
MKIDPAWSSTSRRDFVALSTKVIAGAFCTNLIGLTDKAMGVESSQSVINKVRQSHNNFSTFPKHPLSIAWAPHVTSYPLNTEFPYERDKSTVYPVVEEALMLLGLGDIENPLSTIIDVGDKVVIKPNLCSVTYYPDPVTHPSILVPIVDYVIKAGASTVIIADSPIDYQHGPMIFRSRYTNIKGIVEYYNSKYPHVDIRFKDTASDQFVWVVLEDLSELYGVFNAEHLYHSDFRTVDKDIFYFAIDRNNYCPQGYKIGCYAISNTFLDCDCLINVPKLKTHIHTGITASLKNLMGINKSYMGDVLSKETKKKFPSDWREAPHSRDVPHYGEIDGRFDEYLNDPMLGRKKLNYENDALWRCLSDLNKITQYADKQGKIKTSKQRKVLSIVDGIIGGEGEGPINVIPKVCSAVIAGLDPVNVDAACLQVMGWDVDAVPLVKNCAAITDYPIGTYLPLEECLVGIEPDSPLFNNFFRPPSTFTDETIAPYSIRSRS